MRFLICILLVLSTGCIIIKPGGVGYDRGKENLSMGKSCITTWLGIFTSGHASLHLAKKNGDLKRISYYDEEVSNFIIMSTHCVLAYGEKKEGP